MSSLLAARQAKSDKHLSTLIRTTDYGVTTRRERIDRAMAAGGRLEVTRVFDEAREKVILREMESMRRGNNGWGVPSGNACHPVTIKFNTLKQELADRPTCDQYELHPNHADGDTWFNVLTKTEYDYALSLQARK
jgi:hypothetical protein